MKQSIQFLLLAVMLFSLQSCNEDPPVLPGLAKSYLNIQSKPDSAKIIFNDDETGKITPNLLEELDPGFYKIDLVKENYLDTVIYYIIERNIIDTLNIELREDPGFWWKNFNNTNSALPTNVIKDLTYDSQGGIWVGTSGHGIAILDAAENNWTFFNKDNTGLPGNVINCFLWESDQILWMGTDRGLVRYDGAQWITYSPSNSDMPDEYITALDMDPSGNLWIGTYNMGLVRFDGVNFINYNIFNSNIPSNVVQALRVDRQSGVWVGTWGGGLGKLDQGLWKYYRYSTGDILSDFISSIVYDQDGKLVIGCGNLFYPGGICIFDGTAFTNFAQEFPSGVVTDVAVSEDNSYWIGTGGDGLVQMNGNNVTYYNAENSGNPSNAVSTIVINTEGEKWMGSNGLSKYIGGN